MPDIQEGIIVCTDGRYAEVRVQEHSNCESCGACQTSGMTLTVYNPIGAVTGQKVRFCISQSNMLKIAFVLFFLPLIMVAAGAFAGYQTAIQLLHTGPELLSILTATLFFGISVLLIILYDRKYKSKPGNFAEVVEIIP
jgi:sigma-E factor negative regulatory protein RseC